MCPAYFRACIHYTAWTNSGYLPRGRPCIPRKIFRRLFVVFSTLNRRFRCIIYFTLFLTRGPPFSAYLRFKVFWNLENAANTYKYLFAFTFMSVFVFVTRSFIYQSREQYESKKIKFQNISKRQVQSRNQSKYAVCTV